jgi:hypothetical protein
VCLDNRWAAQSDDCTLPTAGDGPILCCHLLFGMLTFC